MKKSMKLTALLLALTMVLSLAACGAQEQGEASVQSVAMICGLGSTGLAERFSGVVSARSETELKKDDNKAIGEILVAEGDNVKAGQLLFTYDAEQGQLTLEKARLELEQLKAALASKEAELEKLKKEEEKASEANKLSYTLAIQECETAIREANYNISLKEKEVARTEASLENMEIVSPVDGKIIELHEEEGYDNYGNPLCFMKVMETGSYRVKGTINENNVNSLYEGTPVLVRSRLDDETVWTGFISMIDWENPERNNNNYYYDGSDEAAASSNYPFYVELDSADGLLLGQHVYIEPDYGTEQSSDALMLPSFYLMDAEGSPKVWAENAKGKLEKRSVTLGEYSEETDCWEILSGLTAEDYIAFPEDSLKAGMTCTEFSEDVFSSGEPYFEDEFYGDEVYEGEVYEGEVYEGEFGEAAAEVGWVEAPAPAK